MDRRKPIREVALLLGVFLIVRLVLLLAVGSVVDGHEFTDDVGMHMDMVRSPMNAFAGYPSGNAQHPPLLGLTEAIFVIPLQSVCTDFYAFRLALIGFDLLTALLLWAGLWSLRVPRAERIWPVGAMALMPGSWMVSAVMAQDEVIAGFFLALTAWLWLAGKKNGALLACSAGIACGKVFLVLPMAALLLSEGFRPGLAKRLFFAGSVATLAYGGAAIASLHYGGPLPLSGFAPQHQFGVSFWTLWDFHLASSPSGSAGFSSWLALLVSLGVIALALRGKTLPPAKTRLLVKLLAASLLMFFLAFYHVNPEYYYLPLPLLLLVYRSRRAVTLIGICLCVPWAANLFYGVAGAARNSASGGKLALVEFYDKLIPLDPELGVMITLTASVVVTAILTFVCCYEVVRRQRKQTATTDV